MTEYTVGRGGDFATLTAALAAAQPGDTVRVLAGVYREAVKIVTNGLTLIGEPGATLDGGYSHEWAKKVTAKKPGTSWDNLEYKAPPAGARDMIVVAADGVTVAGLRIQNAPSSGIAAGAVTGLTVCDCSFDHLYGTAIKVNGTTGTARRIHIKGNYANAASVMIFDPTRTGVAQVVGGSIKCGNAEDVVIAHNVVVNGFGEGINCGKNIRGFTVVGNLVVDCNHKHYYCNSAVDGEIIDNVALCTGHPAHLWTRGRSPAGFAVNDETERKPFSDNLTWRRNLAINMGVPFQIIPRGDGRMTLEGNTYVWGALTRQAEIKKAARVSASGNIFYITPDGPMPSVENTATLSAGPNLWTRPPGAKWRDGGNVIADPLFVDPTIPTSEHDAYGLVDNVTATLDLSGFQLQPGSPAVVDGVVVFGATAVAGGEPPVDPPVDPDPPDEPEPVDWIAMSLADFEEIRAAVGKAHKMLENMAADTGRE